MIDLELVREYLPQYLSAASYDELLKALNEYPQQGRMYSQRLKDRAIVFQGDGFHDLLFVHLPVMEPGTRKGMIVSNTCDIYRDNERLFEPRMVYAPMLVLASYEEALRTNSSKKPHVIDAHIASIRAQEITQAFFLPKGAGLEEDSFVFLDRIQSAPLAALDDQSIVNRRIFTLSDFGAWLFALKLSIHFCRIRDKVDRSEGVIH
jgi:hypothetical protein